MTWFTWPRPRVIQPCIICGAIEPGHVLVEGVGHEYVAQVCSSHTLWEVLSAQRDEHELLNLIVQINDIDLAASLSAPRPFTENEVSSAVDALDALFDCAKSR
jgi:hypothetical protein